MDRTKLPQRIIASIDDFTARMQKIYRDELVSITIYGSAARDGMLAPKSTVDVVVVLKDTSLAALARSYKMAASEFRSLSVIYFTEEYIQRSLDTFPIEFLDIRANHITWAGRDIFKDISVDTAHLRFQCEHEIKVKILALKRAYLATADKRRLMVLLIRSCTSILHLMRSIMSLKDKTPYMDGGNLPVEIAKEFGIDTAAYAEILNVKGSGCLRLCRKEADRLFCDFVAQTEKLSSAIDAL